MDDESPFDQERANELIGKTALVGLTYFNADGSERDRIQVFGEIVAFDETIVTMKLAGSGKEFTLPPMLDAFEEAEPGEYRLRSTGEVIVDPDLLSKWTIRAPEADSDSDDEDDEMGGSED